MYFLAKQRAYLQGLAHILKDFPGLVVESLGNRYVNNNEDDCRIFPFFFVQLTRFFLTLCELRCVNMKTQKLTEIETIHTLLFVFSGKTPKLGLFTFCVLQNTMERWPSGCIPTCVHCIL